MVDSLILATFLFLVTLEVEAPSAAFVGLGFCVFPSVARTRIEPSVIEGSVNDEAVVVSRFWVR